MFIPKEELKLVKSINADSVGTLYWYNGELIRMIYPEKTVETKKLFEEGIVKELVEKNLLVDTEITNYHIVEGDMVLRHKVIEPITYEYQWTIDMKKDAALLILNILKILKPKGYDLWDCHTGNILFYNGKPIYVDFGSIQKFDKLDLIYAWDSFKCLYLYQQRLYNKGFYEIINAFAKAANTYAAKDEIYRVLYPMIPLKLLKLKNKIEYNYYTVSMLYHRYTLGELQENDTTKIKQILLKLYPYIKFLIPIKENQKYKHSKKRIDRAIKEITDIEKKRRKRVTRWGGYHENSTANNPRFSSCINAILNCASDIDTVIELGGNNGLFGQMFLQKIPVTKYIVSDYDEVALNKGYLANQDGRISYFMYDITYEGPLLGDEKIATRLKSDLCVAMALTHHLLLTQKMSIDALVDKMSMLTKKYLLIEFMPWGLWAAGMEIEKTPEWYNEEWFVQHFERRFDKIYREEVAENRIAFIFVLRNLK